MKYLIIGKNGQLGREFVKVLVNSVGDSVTSVGHDECDITNLTQVIEVFGQTKPTVVINCAAYNQVDRSEEDYVNAVLVNSVGVKNLAYACRKYGIFLVHYSTDYVFDGKKENVLYTEEDAPNPINEYGKSKLMGEEFLKTETDNYIIFRTSWVYGDGKQNFIYKLMQWSKNSEYLKIADDEISVPTSTRTIVDITMKSLKKGLKGLYHLINSGYVSRYEWAKKILEIKAINKPIYPVSKEIFSLPAKRPDFSAMSNSKISKDLGVEILGWEEELKKVILERGI